MRREARVIDERCRTCDSDWGAGAFRPGCAECGAGAMEIACPLCGGSCGARWERQVAHSHERRVAEWRGGCAFPPERWMPLYKARLEAERTIAAAAPAAPPARAPTPPLPAPPPKGDVAALRVEGVRRAVPRRVSRAPASADVSTWLGAPSAASVARTHAWLCAAVDALHADWQHARRHYVRDGDREDHASFDASARWAAEVGARVRRSVVPSGHASVSALLDAVERALTEVHAPDGCPPRASMVLRLEAIWRLGAAALDLPVDAGDAPFDA
ncbi:MAG: hypothetical protein R3B36_27805 [Polyangiaceae bacterium]